ncbi:MAG: hypothetical protein EAX86_05905 [Candidatus Heimdallarchaeota archaeon]|nr:hypothetical protein [Candidatus Heimdallarchaeota archaeon]
MTIRPNNSDTDESFANSSRSKPDNTLQYMINLQKDLKTAADSLRLELLGIHKEIEEIKATVSVLKDSIEYLCDRKALEKPGDDTVGAITSGLDLLQKAPQHLRRTLQVMVQLNSATASQVARRTGKSRSLESDYLNQLERLGILSRKDDTGKHVIFVHERTRSEEADEENEENERNNDEDSTREKIQQMQQTARDARQ